MSARPLLTLLFAGLLSASGCTSDTPSSELDAAAHPDAAASGDAGEGTDAETTVDAGAADGGEAEDSGARQDAGERDASIIAAPACDELEACCPELPAQVQQNCVDTAAAREDGRCAQTLGFAQQAGFCLPPDHDAGVPNDAGPLGPVCAEYLLCCPELGILENRCRTTANNGDEGACAQELGIARQLGRCAPDAGTVTPDAGFEPDAGPEPDAGVELEDAGTSTVSDAG